MYAFSDETSLEEISQVVVVVVVRALVSGCGRCRVEDLDGENPEVEPVVC